MDAQDEPTHDDHMEGQWDDHPDNEEPEDEMLMNEEIEQLQEDF